MSTTSFNTPVLFLIFNRPDTTQKVFDRIRALKPAALYISADGPRGGRNEEVKCKEARSIINQIDWDCSLKTNFSDVNLGCRKAVSLGIDWFFENVEEGIILEDDCLPDLSFFSFCSELLSYYRNDDRIMHIGGTNFQDGVQRGKGSYYFSRFVHVWGWATWKRAWRKYDVSIESFKLFKEQDLINEMIPDKKQQQYWLKNFELVYSGRKDTWDFQWVYTVMINNGLSVIPNANVVTNLGFGNDATHTKLKNSPSANIRTGEINVLSHPDFLIPFKTADHYTFRKYITPGKFQKLISLLKSRF